MSNYTRTEWVNNEAPAINESTLNKIEKGIEASVGYTDVSQIRALGVPTEIFSVVLTSDKFYKFVWDSESVDDDDGVSVLLPTDYTGAGRWVQSQSSSASSNNSNDFIKKALNQSWTGRNYVRRSGDDFRIGFEQARYKAVEFEMNYNTEDYLWMGASYAGESIGVYILPDLTGSFTNSTTGNAFTISVGASFTFDFIGTGFYFNHLSANSGGIWNFSIDGGADIPISTYSESVVQEVSQLVADGLADGTHTVVATFAGADASTVGVPRGWLKYDHTGIGVSTATTIPALAGTLTDVGVKLSYSKTVTQAIAAGSVPDFAIKARPSSQSGIDTNWVPYHGNGSEGFSQRDIVLEILMDGKVVAPESIVEELFTDSLIFKQTYNAYNNDDATNTIMWQGVFTHRFENGELITDHTIKIMNDTFVESGYISGMMPANSGHMDGILVNNGFSEDDTSTWAGPAENRYMENTPNSVAFTSSSTGAFSAVSNNITDILAENAFSRDYSNSIFIQSRTDGLVKAYWLTFDNVELNQGMIFSSSSKYFVASFIDI